MRYTNFGCALGFFCIPFILLFIIPVDGYFLISEPERPDTDSGEKPHAYGDEKSLPEASISSYQWIWSPVLDILNQSTRSVREEVRGYRRISADNLFEHTLREQIFQIICENPGISLSRLGELSHINESTLRYHLFRIEKERCISVFESGNMHHFFENHQTYSTQEKEFYSRYSSGQSGKILQAVEKNPGITRRELADILGVSSPTVTRGVQKLHEDGYLVLVKEGKCTRHYIPAYPRGNTQNT